MNVLIKEINDIIEKNNSKINENIVGIIYLEKLKYLVIDNLKDGQDKFTLDDLVAALEKKNNQSIEFKFKNQSLFLSINLYNNPLSKIKLYEAEKLVEKKFKLVEFYRSYYRILKGFVLILSEFFNNFIGLFGK